MLTIHCAACKRKLFRYDKIGQGHVVRCHKDRVTKWFHYQKTGSKLQCSCGKEIGIDKGGHYRMIANAFTHTGTKRSRR